MKELACFLSFPSLYLVGIRKGFIAIASEEKIKSASADPSGGPIQLLQGYREGEMAPAISFQDRGHGMTTERRTMAFFCARSKLQTASPITISSVLAKVRSPRNRTKSNTLAFIRIESG